MDEKRPALESLTHADLEALVGQTFRLRAPGGLELDLTLREVAVHKHAPRAGGRQGFSLVFRSAVPGHVPQAIYTLTHDTMGTMDLFLVPIGPQDGGMCYEAVFA